MIQPAHFCDGYVLTGGRSSRMGADKALLPFGDRSLGQRMARLAESVCGTVTVVGNRARHSNLGHPLIEDVFQDRGPLAGIHAAIRHSGTLHSLIVGCDMPYVSAEFLRFLVDIARTADADIVVPESKPFGYEPLCAIYGPGCLAPIEACLQAGEVKVSRVFQRLRLRLITGKEWNLFDTHGKLFLNLNTREEYEQALQALLGVGQAFSPSKSTG